MTLKYRTQAVVTNQEWWSARWEMWSDNREPPVMELHGEWVGFETTEKVAIDLAEKDFLTIGDGESDEDCEPVNTEYLNDR